VALLLHISDLHLSSLAPAQVTGDYKLSGVVPLDEQQNRLTLLRSSLTALADWLRARGRMLDAIVVSGDISLAYDEAGFQALPETLSALGDRQPPPERVLAVPGNHDVKWGAPASASDRYGLFVQHVRAAGYVTPLLEGVDIDGASGKPTSGATVTDPLLLTPDNSCALVAINSTNYCGTERELSQELRDQLDAARVALSGKSVPLRELESFTRLDVARVSPGQLFALQFRLKALPPLSGGGPLRVAVLHHQLLPVSADEEFKPFENITNLGALRQFLASQEVALVLHGHKHHGGFYTDNVSMPGAPPGTVRSFAVSSGSTVWRGGGAPQEFARLIEISDRYPHARRLTLTGLTAAAVGSELPPPVRISEWVASHDESPANRRLILGRTLDEVYDRVLSLFESDGTPELRNLVCEITEGATALSLPASYEHIPGVPDMGAWLKEIVQWWQRPDPGLEGRGRRFNHGERIRRFGGDRDQITDVVKALQNAPGTTRAVIQIVDPSRDDMGDVNQRIPAFYSCNLYYDPVTRKLDAVAYFRKQQMRMWWPVNVSEVAHVQAEVIKALEARGVTVSTGAITTIAMLAVDGTARPRLVVPRVDRMAQDNPAELWRVCFDLVCLHEAAAAEELLDFLADWRPTGQVEKDGSAVSLNGLATLASATKMFAEKQDDDTARQLAATLNSLYVENSRYSTSEESAQDLSERELKYNGWQGQVNHFVENITRLTREIASTPPAWRT
jgi:3',5'-cyclic AMP phosphodiesterase CpdA